MALLKSSLNKRYKRIVFIGKSIGTCVQNVLNNRVDNIDVVNIYLSPINKTVEMGMINNSLVITGNEDPLITRENVNQISDLSGVKLIRIDGANHALNIEGDAVKSLEVQLNIIKCIKKYLKSI